MRILLLGEFSALYSNLKDGLLELGHDVVIAAHGDGFKKVPCDISFNSKLPGLLGKLNNRIKPVLALSKLCDFDVVQLVNPFIFSPSFFPREYFFKTLIRQNDKFFLSGAGDDAFFWRYGRQVLKYGPFDDYLKYDLKRQDFYLCDNNAFEWNNWVLDQSRGIIPIMYEYEVSYRRHHKRLSTIPMPINTQKIKYRQNNPGKRLVIFHGLNRYGFKGTRHIEKAFSYLEERYPNDLELCIAGNMQLKTYLEIMERTNVVIDQMYSHSVGMNGLYALSMGKIVMGGAEPESLKSLKVASSPVINLQPSANSIINEVEYLLAQRESIPQLGYDSRIFAERVHGHVEIAERYIETWKQY